MKRKSLRYSILLFLFLILFGKVISKNSPQLQIIPELTITPSPTVFFQPTQNPTPVLGESNIATSSPTIVNRTKAIVVKVVDGDTVHVDINGIKETIRIIGINTPETVDPRRPVECFGKEASEKAKSLLPQGKPVELEQDTTQSNRDKYSRLLRYIFMDGIDYGKLMISEGYAYEYTYDIPYKYQIEYKEAQRITQENKRGLWGEDACKVVQNPVSHAEPSSASTTTQIPKQVRDDVLGISGEDKDCKDFATQSQAQAYFNAKGGSVTNNVDRLDSDSDGTACESLP